LSSALLTSEFHSACINAAPSTAAITIAVNSGPRTVIKPSRRSYGKAARVASRPPTFEAPARFARRLRMSAKPGIL